jgi:leader peptidase (prepilin peptidase)/N-methyltransferase
MILFFIFLCWGSFLNVLAYRLVWECDFWATRSSCPECSHILAWYDLIPIISWLWLRGYCRYCHKPISPLYPIIELLTAILLTALYYHLPHIYFPASLLCCSALIITIRTDLETMLISRFVTLYMIPIGIASSALGLLPISLIDSILGTILGGLFLWIISSLFWHVRKKEGIGQGDIDLLAFIGSFLGILGCWLSLCIGSIIGALVGVGYMMYNRAIDRNIKIPFGPFLATGALIVIFFRTPLLHLLFDITPL